MRESVLRRKISHIIMLLAKELDIDEERALRLFYSTKTYEQLSDSGTGIQLMSDAYILENVLNEIRGLQ